MVHSISGALPCGWRAPWPVRPHWAARPPHGDEPAPDVSRSYPQGRGDIYFSAKQVRATGEGSSYAVYRVPGNRADRCDLVDAEHLVATVSADGGGRQQYVDQGVGPGPSTYYVTALDRAYRESRRGAPSHVR